MIPTVAYNDCPKNNIVHQPYTAFDQGVEAFKLGHRRRDNPYGKRPKEYEFWNDGWRHGYLEYLGVYEGEE